jgi:preprotein translocase subunit SecF
MVDFIKYRKIYYTFSGFLILGSVISLIFYGLNLGIDFTGGSILEIEFKQTRPSNQEIEKALQELNISLASVQPTGEKGVIIKMRNITEELHQSLKQKLSKIGGGFEEKSFESIGPAIGKELTQKTKIFTVLVLLAIISFIAIAFRQASRPLSSFKYGLVASLVAFFHDVLIPLGVFSVLGKFYNVQITIPIVVGLLTILGYSVHDTIVVFDRIRENLLHKKGLSFEQIVNESLNQTLVRSINTSLTTLLVLFSIFFFGGQTLKYFALILILGIALGTYSSIFFAAPILVTLQKLQKS